MDLESPDDYSNGKLNIKNIVRPFRSDHFDCQDTPRRNDNHYKNPSYLNCYGRDDNPNIEVILNKKRSVNPFEGFEDTDDDDDSDAELE